MLLTVCPYALISLILSSIMIERGDLVLSHTLILIMRGSWCPVEPNGTGPPSPASSSCTRLRRPYASPSQPHTSPELHERANPISQATHQRILQVLPILLQDLHELLEAPTPDLRPSPSSLLNSPISFLRPELGLSSCGSSYHKFPQRTT